MLQSLEYDCSPISDHCCVCVVFRLAACGVWGTFHLMTRGDHRYLGKESLKVVVASRRSQVTRSPFLYIPPRVPLETVVRTLVRTYAPLHVSRARTGFTPGPAWRGRNTSESIGTPEISQHQGRCRIRFITHRRDD